MVKQVRNQHTGAGLTQREADQIKSFIPKLLKIGQKKNLDVRQRVRIVDVIERLSRILVEADRQ